MRHVQFALFSGLVVGVCLVRWASACHLPATLPILPGSDHSHENHVGDSSIWTTGFNYSHQRFDDADFTGACFEGTDLAGTSMRGVSATGATFQSLTMTGADFTGARLQGATFLNVRGYGAVFKDADLSGASLITFRARNPVGFAGASFDGADLSGAKLGSGVPFVDASFVGARLVDVQLEYSADFTGADFRNAEITRLNFSDITLDGADLRGARILGFFVQGSMKGANLVGARLENARLVGDLRGATLDGLDLSSSLQQRGPTDLRWASLRDATFGYSSPSSRFEGADLRGADLRQTGDRFRNFDRFTVYDVNTQFPVSFDPTSESLTLYGDNNDDSVVDIEDLNNVRNSFGATGRIGLPGDTVFDGVVDIEDLNAVRNAFGSRAVAPVPEPAAWALCLVAMVAGGLTRSRRHRPADGGGEAAVDEDDLAGEEGGRR